MMVTVFFDVDKKEVLEAHSKLFTTVSLPKLHSPLPPSLSAKLLMRFSLHA